MNPPIRLLTRYPNRRLYDPQLSAYVGLEQVRQLVLQGLTVRVIDHATRHDVTRSTLLQVLVEQQAQVPTLDERALHALIRGSEATATAALATPQAAPPARSTGD